jgi:tetratricopeptide (TPR) repeat protein
MALSCPASKLESRVRQLKEINSVSVWRAPFEAILYEMGKHQAASTSPDTIRALQREMFVHHAGSPLMHGRNLHLQSRYETTDDLVGARKLYLSARTPDRTLEAMEDSEFFRQAMGMEQGLPENPEERELIINFRTAIARQQKQSATYWLGLTYFEAGNFPAAIEWFSERTLAAYPPSPWVPGARYNLARCYEALGQYETARKWLESDKESPQRAGNLLRAKMLAARDSSKSNDDSPKVETGSGVFDEQ